MTRACAALGIALGLAAASTAAAAEHDPDVLPHALTVWDNAARLATPLWLKVWLGFLALTFVSSLFFVRRSRAARFAVAGFVSSHLLLALLGVADIATIRTGLVSLCHVLCWTPAFIVSIGARPQPGDPRAQTIWWIALLVVIGVSLVFDLRDAAAYLYYHAIGHPALQIGS